MFFRSGNCEFALIKEMADTNDFLNVLAPILASAGVTLGRRDVFEFCFPVSQDMGFDSDNLADFAD